MQPSSLIFLVIIGIWAAYFVQYWVRRREHLATIRSVDAFSETMRVLQRRAPLPSVEDGGRSPRTYAVSPARAVRPQVTVKRAEAHAPPTTVTSPETQPSEPRTTDMEVPTMRPSRAVRGMVVLLGVVATAVVAGLVAFGVLLWWSVGVPLAVAAGGVLWLRAGVQAEMKARRAARGRARRAADRDGQFGKEEFTDSVPAAASQTAGGDDVADRNEPAYESAPAVSARHFELAQEVAAAWVPEDAPFDVSAAARATHPAEAPIATPEPAYPAAANVGVEVDDDDDIPLTWEPREVPRPTYTMKARAAERPAPSAQPEPMPIPIDADTAYDDDVPERWIVGG